MDRIYLFVPPEENAEVQALGARRDRQSMRWYIDYGDDTGRFSKWLDDDDEGEDDGFFISSDHAFVAAAMAPCRNCDSIVEVICIYCEEGVVRDEPLTEFTVSNLWAIDDALARQLAPWPTFRRSDLAESVFANHCPHCGSAQNDSDLHSEPDSPFFDIPSAAPQSIQLIRLEGRVQMSGDESFEIR